MKEIVENLRRHPAKIYTLQDIEREKLIPGARNFRTIKKLVEADLAGPNILRAVPRDGGNKTHYAVRGRNIIKFLNTYGHVLVTGAQAKRYGRKASGKSADRAVKN